MPYNRWQFVYWSTEGSRKQQEPFFIIRLLVFALLNHSSQFVRHTIVTTSVGIHSKLRQYLKFFMSGSLRIHCVIRMAF